VIVSREAEREHSVARRIRHGHLPRVAFQNNLPSSARILPAVRMASARFLHSGEFGALRIY